MKYETKCLLISLLGLSIGLIGIDIDHFFDVAYLHWFPVTFFFLFFGIGLFVWRDVK